MLNYVKFLSTQGNNSLPSAILFIFINKAPLRYQTIIDELILKCFFPCDKRFVYSFKFCVVSFTV